MATKKSRSKAALISQYMAKIGSKGGRKKGKTKARDPEIMRETSKKIWAKKKAKVLEAKDEVSGTDTQPEL